jgi:hypothetical protein
MANHEDVPVENRNVAYFWKGNGHPAEDARGVYSSGNGGSVFFETYDAIGFGPPGFAAECCRGKSKYFFGIGPGGEQAPLDDAQIRKIKEILG